MEIFYIAKNFMGRIIGQKGVTINDLQRRSACDIQINQDVPPGQDCEISIRGSRQGIDMVKQMLREIIEIGEFVPVQRIFRWHSTVADTIPLFFLRSKPPVCRRKCWRKS